MSRSKLIGFVFASILTVVGFMFMAGINTGCISNPLTPRQTFADVNDTFISSVTILAAASEQGVMSKEDAQKVIPFVVAADKLIDAYDAATRAGLDGAGVLDQIKAALKQIAPYVEKFTAQGVKPNVSSSPRTSDHRSSGSGGSHQPADYQVRSGTRSVHRAA